MDARATSSQKLKSDHAHSIFSLFSKTIPKMGQAALIIDPSSSNALNHILSGFASSHTNIHRDKPDFVLLDMVAGYLSELNGMKAELETLQDNTKDIILLLCEIHIHANNESARYESTRPQFTLDVDLHEQKNEYLALDRQSENEFQSALSRHAIAMQKIQDDIQVLDRELARLKSADAAINLRDFPFYQECQKRILDEMEAADKIATATTFFQHIFCYMPESAKRAYHRVNELQKMRVFLDKASFEELKNHLTPLLEVECARKCAELKLFSANKPIRNEQHREKYIEIEARVRSDELEYYSGINHTLMLDFSKMYFAIHKIYRILNKDMAHNNMRDLFARLLDTFKTMAAGFYCEEPGRYYFSYYMQNMHAIKDNDILNKIMLGDATIDHLRLVAPAYLDEKVTLRV